MIEVLVPRDIVNDDSVTIVQVMFESGSNISKGDVIFELETSKANIDVDSPCDGILTHDLSKGDVLSVGSILCKIGDSTINKSLTNEKPVHGEDSSSDSAAVISKSARKRAQELNVDLSSIHSGLVSVADVEKMALDQSQNDFSSSALEELEISENSIVIIGGGGHAKMCIDLLKQSNEYQILGIIDDKLKLGTNVFGIKVIGGNDSLHSLFKLGLRYVVNGVGAIHNPKLRSKIHQELTDIGFQLPNIVHPSSIIEPSVSMGLGNQIMMGAVVGSDVQIGNGCIVNSGSIISHDCVLRDHCHVAPGAILAGSVDIGESSLIGMGATIFLGLTIGRDAMIFNGVNVLKNVPEGKIVDGN